MNWKIGKKLLYAVKVILIWIFAAIFFAPLLLVIVNSFKSKGEIMTSAISLPKSFYLNNFVTIVTESNFVSSFLTSLMVVTITTTLTVLVAAMAGYSLAKWKNKVAGFLMTMIMCTLFVPFQVYMVAMIVVVKDLGLTGNLFGLIMVYVALGMPVPIFLCRSYAVGMPKEIEEAAIIDGCSNWSMFFRIVLPLMKPILATVAVLNALWVWGEFLVAFLVYGNAKPMTLPLSQRYFYGTYSNQWNLILTNFLVSSIPVILFYIVMQKHIVKGITAGAVKG
ncbi:carbohydrate ABC transporter permease [Anaerocolumna xylanovorans]|uniref:Raffinose/stachyose/melibiose transport system permease protein n=1 Tax=Anaerocolumna xylanovorans DSM 12503 TaxID=1121345 RepID=A0A1M7YGS5_9FIRM|nr:carbohydrate ABC transporter permease [Anaerocolumna xylanovorans]SHO51769.1 raffinose/stachyose/melibiose transport system permease protein [Anaerocolumna xylanovorans DSM 12503]